MRNIFLLSVLIMAGCASTHNGISQYRLGHYQRTSSFAMPKEGWATDPNLSYRLYSYYPIDYATNGLPGRMGWNGLYYH